MQSGDITFARTGASVGKSYEYTKDDGQVYFAGFLIRARINKEINSSFVYQQLKSEKYWNYIKIMSQRSGQPGVNSNEYGKYEIFISSRLEQNRISNLFNSLDSTITLHEKKLKQLKSLKQAFLQRMFADKSKYPNVRFNGFADVWEQRKLGEVLKERNNRQPQSTEYPLVSFTVENGVTPKTDRYDREQLVVGDKNSKKYKVTVLNDIVYNPANLKFGAISRNKYGNAVFSPIYVTFSVNNDVATPKFIEMFVTRNDFIKHALKYQQGTVYERQSVSPADLLSMNIYLPKIEEQQKIGTFFNKLDSLITLQQRKLTQLKQAKQFLLRNMFV